MRRLVVGVLKNKKITIRLKTIHQRAFALFLLVGFLFGTWAPTVSAYTQPRPDSNNSHIKNESPAERNRPMKQNYAGALQPTVSDKKAAADARPITGSKNVLPSSGPGEVLRNATDGPKIAARELVDKRTATSSVFVNADGSITEKNYLAPKHYKKDGKWELIDTTLVEDKNAADSNNIVGQVWGDVRSLVSESATYKVKSNDWQARFAPSDAKQGMVRVGKGSKQTGFTPVNAKQGVKPLVTKNGDGYQVVRYIELWPGVDVEYVVESEAVKENIILKSKDSANQVAFTVSGGQLEERIETQKLGNFEVTKKAYVIKGASSEDFAISPANLILNNFGFVSDQSIFKQEFKGDKITLSVDKNYLQSLPDKAFPAVIDPSTFYGTFGTRNSGDYVSFKSDGYVCGSTVCNPYAGSLYDSNNTLRYWRSAFYTYYGQLNDPNKSLQNATLHLQQRSNESFWTGTFAAHTYYVGHAVCLNNFNCLNGNAFNVAGTVGTSGDINVTSIYAARKQAGDYGAWLMLGSEDGTNDSFKNFDPGTGPYNSGSYISFTYSGPPAAPSIKSPTANQVYIDPQPSFSVAYATNPNGSTDLQYQMRVSSAPGGAGFLMASPLLRSTQWTMPDNVLQDGSTYYLQARSFDPITGLYSDWGPSVPFRINMRNGADSTQTSDTLGPVSVNLATGGLSTNVSSHSSVALGGSLGVNLSYNSPLKSRSGLVGEYWNVSSGYGGGAPSGTPNLTRVDQNIDFNWDTGSPSDGSINTDWYYGRWTGYFIAPKAGTYQFGASNDDSLTVKVNNQQVYSNGGCYSGICYDGSNITLQEGQTVPIEVQYLEATGPAYARIFVKGPVGEQIIPSDWLRTGVRTTANKKQGLTGSYYARLDGTFTFSPNNYKVIERVDPYLNFNWGTGSPVPNGPADFLIRWTGYVTAPTTGNYNFGTRSDDGTRIYVGNNNTLALDDWLSQGAPAAPKWGNTNIALTANTPTKITIEYYDDGGPASFELWSKLAGVSGTEQIVPSSWLSTEAQILPDGWDLGVDGSGTARYSYLKSNQNSAVLSDSSGGTHEYVWTGSGYKPPVNEDGQLLRNTDGTYTFQDIDGQTYVFDIDGKLLSASSAADDRNPAALKYEYQSLNGGPVHLYKIKDGVDQSRDLTLYYSGQSQCGNVPLGFDASAPTNMLCAVQTNDGRTTYFYYAQQQLARVSMPGNSIIDYQYEAVNNGTSTVGYRMTSIRDAVANDEIAAGKRTDDDSVRTQIGYDVLGRATSVKQPAPTSGANRLQHTIEYLPGSKSYIDENGIAVAGYAGMTRQHIVGAPEPNGYSKRIKYDSLFRTIETTNNMGLSTIAEWDPAKDLVYSTTDPTGLKSTTVYDDEDRAVDSYGPAPKAWFVSGVLNGQVPQAAYVNQVPHSSVGYDEGIAGLAVGWYDYTKLTGNSTGSLTGAPKMHDTGINAASGTMVNDFTAPPIAASAGAQGIGFAGAGKLRLSNGTYTISADTSDGIRVWVDDKIVLDQWIDGAYRTVSGTSFAINDSSPKRILLEAYRRTGSTGSLNIRIAQNGGFAATTDWSSYLKPDYGLVTSNRVYDNPLRNTITGTSYGTDPELGLPQKMSNNQFGIGLTSSVTYEQRNDPGSLLRPTKIAKPGDSIGNPSATNSYYGATETRDNPCTSATENYKQAGLAKLVTGASADTLTSSGRVTENVYDDAGRVVASRTNNDGWICTTYDARGRVAAMTIPAIGSEAGRTIANNYAVYGDPAITSSEDAQGVNLTEVDLLGRTTYYHDSQWNETWTGYDDLGRLLWRNGPAGNESYVYDNFGRLSQQKIDNITYAVINYDQYGRTQNIEYPNAGGQKMVVSRDALERVTGQSYYSGGSQTPGDNLIPNSSYEQASANPNEPEGWHGSAWGNNTPVYTYLNEGYTGNRSVKTELTSYTDGDAKWQSGQVAIAPNTTYEFKEYYKSNVTTEVLVEYKNQDQSLSYEWLGFVNASNDWKKTSFSFTTPSTATHVTVLHIIKNVGWLTVDDSELHATASGGQSIIASDQVVRSQAGRVVSGTENGQNKSYTYDSGGRLTNATIGSNTYVYGFGVNTTCPGSTNYQAGKNANRTSQTINGVKTNFCYDYADRLVSSSDPLSNAAQYDSHGNMTQIGSGASPLRMYYDSSDRTWGSVQYDGSGNGTAVYYGRDVQGRVIHRETDNISAWNWTATDMKWYGYSANGESPSVMRDANWNVIEQYITLAGGVTLTVRPTLTGNVSKVYSLPNLSGAIMATTDASGALTGTFSYDPFGNKTSGTLPGNTSSGASFGWAGQAKKFTETSLTLAPMVMGARGYLPTIGRFTQVDPVPGGNANDYVYAIDPVNSNDFSGKFLLQGGGGAGFLQSAAGAARVQPATGAARVQPAAPAPYYQAATGLRTVQSVGVVNSVIVRIPVPAPKPRDDSTRMPVATVKAMDYLTSAASEWQSANFVPGDGQFHTYLNLGGSAGTGGLGIAAGVKFNPDSVHFYYSSCVVADTGLGWSLSLSNSPISTGWSGEMSAYYMLGGSIDNSGSYEIGVGTPGVSACVTYTF